MYINDGRDENYRARREFGRSQMQEDRRRFTKRDRTQRADMAEQRFILDGIEYMKVEGYDDKFIVFSPDKRDRYTFFAGTGDIIGPYEEKGLDAVCRISRLSRKGRRRARTDV